MFAAELEKALSKYEQPQQSPSSSVDTDATSIDDFLALCSDGEMHTDYYAYASIKKVKCLIISIGFYREHNLSEMARLVLSKLAQTGRLKIWQGSKIALDRARPLERNEFLDNLDAIHPATHADLYAKHGLNKELYTVIDDEILTLLLQAIHHEIPWGMYAQSTDLSTLDLTLFNLSDHQKMQVLYEGCNRTLIETVKVLAPSTLEIQTLRRTFSKLKKVQVFNATALWVESHLHHLNGLQVALSACNNYHVKLSKHVRLEELTVTSNSILTFDAGESQLTSVIFDASKELQSILLQNSHISKVVIYSCDRFQRLKLPPNVESLTIIYCLSFTNLAITDLPASLKNIFLQDCPIEKFSTSLFRVVDICCGNWIESKNTANKKTSSSQHPSSNSIAFNMQQFASKKYNGELANMSAETTAIQVVARLTERNKLRPRILYPFYQLEFLILKKLASTISCSPEIFPQLKSLFFEEPSDFSPFDPVTLRSLESLKAPRYFVLNQSFPFPSELPRLRTLILENCMVFTGHTAAFYFYIYPELRELKYFGAQNPSSTYAMDGNFNITTNINTNFPQQVYINNLPKLQTVILSFHTPAELKESRSYRIDLSNDPSLKVLEIYTGGACDLDIDLTGCVQLLKLRITSKTWGLKINIRGLADCRLIRVIELNADKVSPLPDLPEDCQIFIQEYLSSNIAPTSNIALNPASENIEAKEHKAPTPQPPKLKSVFSFIPALTMNTATGVDTKTKEFKGNCQAEIRGTIRNELCVASYDRLMLNAHGAISTTPLQIVETPSPTDKPIRIPASEKLNTYKTFCEEKADNHKNYAVGYFNYEEDSENTWSVNGTLLPIPLKNIITGKNFNLFYYAENIEKVELVWTTPIPYPHIKIYKSDATKPACIKGYYFYAKNNHYTKTFDQRPHDQQLLLGDPSKLLDANILQPLNKFIELLTNQTSIQQKIKNIIVFLNDYIDGPIPESLMERFLEKISLLFSLPEKLQQLKFIKEYCSGDDVREARTYCSKGFTSEPLILKPKNPQGLGAVFASFIEQKGACLHRMFCYYLWGRGFIGAHIYISNSLVHTWPVTTYVSAAEIHYYKEELSGAPMVEVDTDEKSQFQTLTKALTSAESEWKQSLQNKLLQKTTKKTLSSVDLLFDKTYLPPLVVPDVEQTAVNINGTVVHEMQVQKKDILRKHLFIRSAKDLAFYANPRQIINGTSVPAISPLLDIAENGGVLVIDLNHAGQTAMLQSLMDNPPSYQGYQVSPEFQPIVIYRGKQDPSLSRRTASWKMESSMLHMPTHQAEIKSDATPIVIDLFGQPSWTEELLLNKIIYHGHGAEIGRGALLQACNEKRPLIIYNPPQIKDLLDPDFARIFSERKFFNPLTGCVVAIPDEVVVSIRTNTDTNSDIPDDVIIDMEEKTEQSTKNFIYIGIYNLKECRKGLKIDAANHTAETVAGLLETYNSETDVMYLTESISIQHWKMLMAIIRNIRLTYLVKKFIFQLAPGVAIAGLNLQDKPVENLRQPAMIALTPDAAIPVDKRMYVTSDPQLFSEKLRDQLQARHSAQVQIINITNYADMFVRIERQHRPEGGLDWHSIEGNVLTALRAGHHILLTGNITHALYQRLLSLLTTNGGCFEGKAIIGKLYMVADNNQLKPKLLDHYYCEYSFEYYKKLFPVSEHNLIDNIHCFYKLARILPHSNGVDLAQPPITRSRLMDMSDALKNTGLHKHNPLKSLFPACCRYNTQQYAYLNVLGKLIFDTDNQARPRLQKLKTLIDHLKINIDKFNDIIKYAWLLLNCFNGNDLQQIIGDIETALISKQQGILPTLNSPVLEKLQAVLKKLFTHNKSTPEIKISDHQKPKKELVDYIEQKNIQVIAAEGRHKDVFQAIKSLSKKFRCYQITAEKAPAFDAIEDGHIRQWLADDKPGIKVLILKAIDLTIPGIYNFINTIYERRQVSYKQPDGSIKNYLLSPEHKLVVMTNNGEEFNFNRKVTFKSLKATSDGEETTTQYSPDESIRVGKHEWYKERKPLIGRVKHTVTSLQKGTAASLGLTLEGTAGTGKSTLIADVLLEMGYEKRSVKLSSETSTEEKTANQSIGKPYFYEINAGGKAAYNMVLRSYKERVFLLLNELNIESNPKLFALILLLAEQPAKQFGIFATQNPCDYPDRKSLPEDIADYFPVQTMHAVSENECEWMSRKTRHPQLAKSLFFAMQPEITPDLFRACLEEQQKEDEKPTSSVALSI